MVRKWPLLLVLVAVVLIVGAIWVGHAFAPTKPASPPPAPVVAVAQPEPPKPAPEPAKPAPAAPAFDIVRVAPDGSMVVAGRAEPGAVVSLRADGQEIASAKADAQGQFAIVPDKPLPPGGRELTLTATAEGGKQIPGQAPVVVAVPEPPASNPPAAAPEAVAVLAPPDAPPKLLEASPALPGDVRLGLDVVDYDEHGAIRFTGRAQPGEVLRLYLDDAALGEARAGADGTWSLTPADKTVPPGQHRLRVDEIGENGAVIARIELPFLRSLLADQDVPPSRVVVRRGQNLWQIAQRAYGHGVRYWVIYRANRDQIRDPNRIYPGQVFALPAPRAAVAAPPPSAVPPLPAGLVTPSMPPSSVSRSR